MSGFLAKMVLFVVAVYLLLGFIPATSALHPDDDCGEKSSWHVDRKDGLRKVIGRTEGNFGCQNGIVSQKIVPARSLRVATNSPPSPVKNKASSQKSAPAPPPSVA